MRLHHLHIQAFGPFATEVSIDFDDLSAAGLFLLSGATGAGKTSVLDAICFALYGDVPGDRGSAKRLRADQAPADAVPRVTLEATLSGRRFRIIRSPAWERPKKRGSGTTTQQSTVTIAERVDQTWLPLSSRIDETGDLLTRLVGMNLPQFTQVAMLPQGRFQAFLRARSDDRHRLLQQLFRTGRFEDVERWLRDRRLELIAANRHEHGRVADLVSRLSEVSGVALPVDWDLPDLMPAAHQQASACAALVDETSLRVETSAAHERSARADLERAREIAARRARHLAAVEEEARLQSGSRSHAADVARLDAARRAAAVAPLHRLAVSASSTAARARDDAEHSLQALGRGLETTSLDALVERCTAEAASARAAVPRAARLRELVAETASLHEQLTLLELASTHDAARLAALPPAIARLRESLTEAEAAAARVEGLREARAVVHAQVAAAQEAVTLTAHLADARREWLDARAATLELKERLVALQHARIDGMAAELAGALAVGGCCPVCGSAEHPHKATSAPGAPDAETERAARAAVDDGAVLEHAHDVKVRDLEAQVASAKARSGAEPTQALAARDEQLRLELAAAVARAHQAGELTRELADAETEQAALEQATSARAAERARLEGRRASLDDELVHLRRELGERGDVDLERAAEQLEQTARMAAAARTSRDRASAAVLASDEARRAMVEAAEDAGFTSVHEAVAAALDRAVLTDLAGRVEAHSRRLAAVREILASPEATEAAALPDVDLDSLEAHHAHALAAHSTATAAIEAAHARQRRVTSLATELERAVARWSPVREELALTTDLAAFVEGKSNDNVLRMRLSAYVLAFRLTQVVAAANERLARMSDQRYSLEHTGRRGAGETRGGLSLLIRDDWSGESRDPATLSGGETFVVSLALALGLADVITHESGGAALDTLFVDEGFGSLDADTLDDVMDTLDSLRDGGRVVGVVSHVAEMRDRIPTQLVVSKSRAGSTLSVRR